VPTARYLVTGAAGFIGSHIARALTDRGESVRLFDNMSTGREVNLETLQGDIEIIHGDVCDLESVRRAAAGVEIIFHQAALASVPRSIVDPLAALETNVNGTHNILLAARDAGARRVVYASSSSVYGDTPTLPKCEEMCPHPLSPYAVHKLTGELLCRTYTQTFGLETVALRYFNVFGPQQDPASEYAAVIPRFLTALLEGRRPILFGDGSQTRDFTYVSNVVQANLLAAEASAAVGRAMNIGCGKRTSLTELLRLAGDLLGVRVEPEYRPARPGDIRDSLADISLSRQILGYEPTVGLREGLERTAEALHARGMSVARVP
jgi:nucleoside-diphosphate-sugar epimerase